MALRTRNVLSLCAGVGGLELGIALALHHRGEVARGICYVEREAAAAASLVASMEAGWFHPAPIWSDLATFDGEPWRGIVDILASGDPCQDNSDAGQRAGARGKRFLAPLVCRIARECRPRLIFRENVTGNTAGQLEAIAPELEELGYRVAAGIFSSDETNGFVGGRRLFIMAEAHGNGQHRSQERHITPPRGIAAPFRQNTDRCSDRTNDAPSPRWQWSGGGDGFRSVPALRRKADAMADRVERLRATGNGVDPLVAAYAFLSLSARLRAAE